MRFWTIFYCLLSLHPEMKQPFHLTVQPNIREIQSVINFPSLREPTVYFSFAFLLLSLPLDIELSISRENGTGNFSRHHVTTMQRRFP